MPLAALLSSRERCSDEHEATASAWAERVLEQDQRAAAAGQAGGSPKQAQQDVCMLEGLLKVLSALVARAVEKEGVDTEDVRGSEAAHRRTLLVRAQALHLRKRIESTIPEELLRADVSASPARASLLRAPDAAPELMLHHLSVACRLPNQVGQKPSGLSARGLLAALCANPSQQEVIPETQNSKHETRNPDSNP